MADILQEIASQDEKQNEISLKELEQAFDDISNDKKNNNERQIKKLVKAFDKNIEKEEYALDSKGIINKIINQKEDFSKINNNTIKVYQLCKNLEYKKEWMEKYIEIDGDIWTELIEDRIATYDEWLSLMPWESMEFDAISNKLKIITKFGTYDEVLADYSIIDNKETCKSFINDRREEYFNKFISENEIINSESEFKKWLTEKYPNALEEICLQNIEVDKKKINVLNIDYKNPAAYIEYSRFLNIESEEITQEDMIPVIQKTREEYNENVETREKYEEFMLEVDKATASSFTDAYKNINLLLWDNEYKKFSKETFSFHDITKENIWTLYIDSEGQLVIWEEEKQILPGYDFSEIPLDIRLLIVINISKILDEFVLYYPDNTKRQDTGILDTLKGNIDAEKKVLAIYTDLMKQENIDKFKNGTLDLNKINSTYREKAFWYFLSELKKNGETSENIIKNRTVDSPMLKFVESKINSIEEKDSWYVSLYYTFIQEKLWNILKITTIIDKKTKKESTTWYLDESKINTTFDSNYERLICQKWTQKMAGANVVIEGGDRDEKITELSKKIIDWNDYQTNKNLYFKRQKYENDYLKVL